MKQVDVTRDNDRVYWHSRRGMLEIDVKLMPFAKDVYPSLSEEEKADYRLLLQEEDTQLFAWVLGREVPENPRLASIMERVLEYGKSSGKA